LPLSFLSSCPRLARGTDYVAEPASIAAPAQPRLRRPPVRV